MSETSSLVSALYQARANGGSAGQRKASRPASENQTETGFRSFEPAALQKVVVSVVVWPFLVAVSSIGRQVLPSARVVAGATGLAPTTVGGGGVALVDLVVGSTV
jgi:hypothetical protein